MNRTILPLSALLLGMGLASHALASPVFTQSVITGDASIWNQGTLVVANDLGASPSNVTVNGVTFGTSQAGLSGFTNGGGDFSVDPFSAALDALLSDLVFDPAPAGGASLSIGGLTAGEQYVLQLLFSNDANPTGDNVDVTVDVGGSAFNLVGWQPSATSLLVAFTATGSTLVTSFGPGPGADGTTGRAVLNAYSVHRVPEPASLGLLGLGVLGVAAWRRRRVAPDRREPGAST